MLLPISPSLTFFWIVWGHILSYNCFESGLQHPLQTYPFSPLPSLMCTWLWNVWTWCCTSPSTSHLQHNAAAQHLLLNKGSLPSLPVLMEMWSLGHWDRRNWFTHITILPGSNSDQLCRRCHKVVFLCLAPSANNHHVLCHVLLLPGRKTANFQRLNGCLEVKICLHIDIWHVGNTCDKSFAIYLVGWHDILSMAIVARQICQTC